MLKNKKVIIFDMDGTLIDSVGVWNEVDKILISQLKSPDITMEEDVQKQRDRVLREFSGTSDPYIKYCAFLKEKYGFEPSAEEVHTIRYEIAQKYLENTVDYKHDADAFIRKLKNQGYILAIASTTARSNMNVYKTLNKNIITKANLDDYFSVIYTREDAKEIKPNPEIFLKVMNDFGVTAEECLVFEDSLVGVEAAKNAGMEVVVVYDKYSDNERDEINTLADYITDGFTDFI